MNTNMVFLWRFHALLGDTRAISGTRSSPVTRLPSFYVFYVEKQHRGQHWTKNSPKPATNCAQFTQTTRKQPHVDLSEVQFHIHNFILAFCWRRWISHTKSINRGPCNTTRLIVKVRFRNSIVFSHPPVSRLSTSRPSPALRIKVPASKQFSA